MLVKDYSCWNLEATKYQSSNNDFMLPRMTYGLRFRVYDVSVSLNVWEPFMGLEC